MSKEACRRFRLGNQVVAGVPNGGGCDAVRWAAASDGGYTLTYADGALAAPFSALPHTDTVPHAENPSPADSCLHLGSRATGCSSTLAARLAVKAAADRVLALLAVLTLAPLLIVVLLAVRASSPGPALFRQRRVGRDGATFTMLKFRTMYDGAESRLVELLDRNESAGGVLFKMRHDPRVTPLGRVLRRTSLDELPQLFNVLAGTMSMVGPRPPLPAEVARYGVNARRRLLVKPGLTGLWQVSGRSDLAFDDAVRLDLAYVENWSLALDAKVLVRTVRAVLRGDGAY